MSTATQIDERRAQIARLARSWAPLLILAFIGAALLWLFDPLKVPIFPPCPLHALTGLHCPGCGAARACHALAHADVYAAFRWNPLLVIVAPFLIIPLVRKRRPGLAAKGHPHLIQLLAASIIAFGIARNIPLWPFSLLAPTDIR